MQGVIEHLTTKPEVEVAVLEYKVAVSIGKREIEIRESVDTNYREGEAKQMASLFYRAMLACGHSPTTTSEALAAIAQAGGSLDLAGKGEEQLFFPEEGVER